MVPIPPFLCEPGDNSEWEGEHDDVAVLRDVVQGLQEPQLEIVRRVGCSRDASETQERNAVRLVFVAGVRVVVAVAAVVVS